VHIEIRERDGSPWCGTLPLGYGPDLSPFAGAVALLVLAGDIGRACSTAAAPSAATAHPSNHCTSPHLQGRRDPGLYPFADTP
jgi:hypothetical protein